LFFVVSLSAGLSESQVVIRCTCCSSCFPYVSSFISKKAQQGRLLFLKKLPQKLFFVVSLSAGLSEQLYVVLVVQVVFPISARRRSNDGLLFLKKLPQKLFFVVSLAAGLSESQVVTCCTCCFSCFPYISKKTQQEAAA